MAVVSTEQLSRDMQASVAKVEAAGLIPQSRDQPLNANDLLFYLTETSMPMAEYLREHGLFLDNYGLNFDFDQFDAIRYIANEVISQRQAGNLDGVWKQFDLSTNEDVDTNGGYILTALAVIGALYRQE